MTGKATPDERKSSCFASVDLLLERLGHTAILLTQAAEHLPLFFVCGQGSNQVAFSSVRKHLFIT